MTPNAIGNAHATQESQLKGMRESYSGKLFITETTITHLQAAIDEIEGTTEAPTTLGEAADNMKRIANAIKYIALASLESSIANKEELIKTIATLDQALAAAASPIVQARKF